MNFGINIALYDGILAAIIAIEVADSKGRSNLWLETYPKLVYWSFKFS